MLSIQNKFSFSTGSKTKPMSESDELVQELRAFRQWIEKDPAEQPKTGRKRTKAKRSEPVDEEGAASDSASASSSASASPSQSPSQSPKRKRAPKAKAKAKANANASGKGSSRKAVAARGKRKQVTEAVPPKTPEPLEPVKFGPRF
jgi:hypothetical protein